MPQRNFRFEAPDLPPTLNHAYKTVVIRKKGRKPIYLQKLTPESVAWMSKAQEVIETAMNEARFWVDSKTELELTVHLYCPKVLTWDIDGRMKLLFDSLKKALGVDDRYVFDLILKKRRAKKTRIWCRVAIAQTAAPLEE